MKTKPETYTAEFVALELEDILNEILENKDLIYLGEVFESRPYSRQRSSLYQNTQKSGPRL